MFLSDCAATSSSSPPVNDDEIDGETLSEILREQQTAWEDTISENPTDLLQPTHPIDDQMICNLQTIASRLAVKAEQLIGNKYV